MLDRVPARPRFRLDASQQRESGIDGSYRIDSVGPNQVAREQRDRAHSSAPDGLSIRAREARAQFEASRKTG